MLGIVRMLFVGHFVARDEHILRKSANGVGSRPIEGSADHSTNQGYGFAEVDSPRLAELCDHAEAYLLVYLLDDLKR